MSAHSYTAATLLALTTILLSVLGTFHDDAFYKYGYERNGAHDSLGEQLAAEITDNWQAYLVGEEPLRLFHDDQALHLAEVKQVYIHLRLTLHLLLLFATLSLAWLAARGGHQAFINTLERAAIILAIITALTATLSLGWEWSFTKMHELLFTGQWQFPGTSLMLQLWGGNFFPLAAGYVLLKNLSMAGLLYLFATSWRTFTSQR